MVFKTLDIRQQRTVILEKGETNEVSSANASAWIVSSHSVETGNLDRAQRSSWVKEMNLRETCSQSLPLARVWKFAFRRVPTIPYLIRWFTVQTVF